MKPFKSIVFNNFKTLAVLAFMCMLSVLLLMLRLKLTKSFFMLFLVWNLFLAVLPFMISFYLSQRKRLEKWQLLLSAVAWLLLLPNAPYIITDFVHLSLRTGWMALLDVVVIASFAFSGLLLYLLSVHDMEKLFKQHFSQKLVTVGFVLIPFLCGFGIYLGRFLRFNSWDVLQNPISLLIDILNIIFHPLSNWPVWLTTFGFGWLLWFMSYILEKKKYFHVLRIPENRIL